MAKVRILKEPTEKMAKGGQMRPPKDGGYGNQSGWALDTGGRVLDPTLSTKNPFATNDTIKEVPREESNLEAEKNEELTRQNSDGTLSKFRIGGKKHSVV